MRFILEQPDIIDQIIEAEFSKLKRWSRPTLLGESINPGRFDRFEQDRLKFFVDFRRQFLLFDDVTLNDLLALVRGHISNRRHNTNAACLALKNLDYLSPPPWCAEGFETLEQQPDYLHWARKKRWSNPEMLSLSLGFDPSNLSAVLVQAERDEDDFEGKRLELFCARSEIVTSHFPTSSRLDLSQTPVEFCEWATKLKLEVPSALFEAVNQIHGAKFKAVRLHKPARSQADDDDPREIVTLRKLVIGLAVKGYAYDPKAQRSSVPTEIQGDLDQLGITLDKATILKHLRKSQIYLSQEE